MKVAYAATYNALNVNKWSGSGYYIGKSLANQKIDLVCLRPLKAKFKYFFKGEQLLYKYLFNKIYYRDRNVIVLKDYAHQLKKQLEGIDVDLLFCPSSLPIAYFDWNKPIVFWTDLTFHRGLTYSGLEKLSNRYIDAGHRMEKNALERCTLAIYCSEWAAKSAIEYYQTPPHKVKVVPFGANLETDFNLKEIKELISSRSRSVCNLLFLGVEWQRKGGPRALQVTEELNKRGLRTFLHVVGGDPESNDLPEFVKIYGFISKKTLEGRMRLEQLFSQSHFLIMLSEAEAYGVVLCEANAFGVPCIASDVGGIPTIIRDEVNGKLFSLIDDDIDEICDLIFNKFNDFDSYTELAKSSFNEYEVRLNWKASGAKVKELFESVL